MFYEAKLREYQMFSAMTKKMLLVVGLWPVPKPNILHRSLPFVNMLMCVSVTCFIFNFVRLHLSSVGTMTKGLSLGASFMTTLLKIMCITFNSKDLKELHDTLDEIFDDMLAQSKIQSEILKRITIVRQLATFFSFLVFLSVFTYAVVPMVFILRQHMHHIQPIRHILAFPAAYPWNTTAGGLGYALNFSYEVYCAAVLFFVTSGVDALFPFYIFQMTGLLQVMSYRMTSLTSKDQYSVVIKECVVKYQTLIRCRDIVQTIYGPIIVWMLLTSAIILCALTFQMSKLESISVGRVCLFIAYCGSKMLQTFICSWAGSMLTVESENFRDSIYSCDWPGTGQKRLMTSILIMLAQNPLVIVACNYFAVSVNMFAMILNTTVSYFFLLKTMEEKEN